MGTRNGYLSHFQRGIEEAITLDFREKTTATIGPIVKGKRRANIYDFPR